ncbi:hypothetical protein [Aurantimonas sp. 22II-16-19i]|uniref:hypothetical protein n=1 Tax=Aurantimonas sp. 22II-16-19i TaxID=1317114 RepID=UPI0009F7BD0B|nr:hypothetical protein [Aurantimonas sp. 22II-16-19i]ORE90988.1 hypothetical protein ATO4_20039 [Aurantimonas sp. 22II-16-19i]
MSEASTMEGVVTKGAFAEMIGVSPGRVSQMIAEGKIGPDAIAGEGRMARIRVEVAKRQIRERRDPGQALGNGLSTRLGGPAAGSASDIQPSDEAPGLRHAVGLEAAGGNAGSPPLLDDFEQRFKLEKLQEIQRKNRKAAEEEEARRGRFMETADARQQMTRLAGAMLSSFEGSLASLATAVSSKFGIPQRDVLHLLKAEFRAYQEGAAKRHAAKAEETSATLESVIVQDGGPLQ